MIESIVKNFPTGLIFLTFGIIFLHSIYLYIKYMKWKNGKLKYRENLHSIHLLYYLTIITGVIYIIYFSSESNIPLIKVIIFSPFSIVSLILVLVSRRQLGIYHSPHVEILKDHKLITAGLYKHLDHPMYYFETLAMACIVFMVNNVIAYLCLSFWIAAILIKIKYENRLMKKEFQVYTTLFGKSWVIKLTEIIKQ